MKRRMDAWMTGRVDGWMYRCMKERVHEIAKCMGGCWMNGGTVGSGWTNRCMDGWIRVECMGE